MTEAELLALIDRAEREEWTELELRGEQIEVLPPAIGRLRKLERLVISNQRRCPLKELPAEIGQLVNLTSLNLSNNLLTAIPPEIGQLVNLTSLDLSNNALTAIPPEIGQLVNLTSLNLSYDRVEDVSLGIDQWGHLTKFNPSGRQLMGVPPEIDLLGNHLASLNFRGNRLTVVPPEIGQLVNLTSLNLTGNQLTDVPPEIGQLVHLTSLYLNGNRLTAVPPEIGQLVHLTLLSLSNNQLTAAPPELFLLPRLERLYLSRNPITSPPPELLRRALTDINIPVNLAAMRRYYEELYQTGETLFYEAKLLIIGEGGAGKTSLACKLQNPTASLPTDADSTAGIDIIPWEFPLPHEPQTSYHAHIWDFGGQEIYFATHQFFLTRRSVYILLADTRQQHTDFYTWLLMQETFGGDSPVLLLKNQNRQKGNLFTIENLPELRHRFPNLKEVLELDLNEVPSVSAWEKLLQELKYRLLQLDHIGQPRPRSWEVVRQTLQADPRETLTETEYRALCAKYGLSTSYALDLSDYLHNVGDILHFRADPVLTELVILKPTWGLDAVYRVLDNRQIVERLGRFSLADLRVLWHEPKYSGHHHHLLQLMQAFQLCYPLPDQPHEYIAPQLLDTEVPAYAWEAANNLQLRYRYPVFMPRGLLSRAIVKLHKYIEDQRLVWRAGVILRDEEARAELLELRGPREIRIRLAGQFQRDLLMHIVRTLDELHQGFPNLQYERLIPCNCPICAATSEPHFFAFDELRYRQQNGKATIECRKAPFHAVVIQPLLDDIFVPTSSTKQMGQFRLHELLNKLYNEQELKILCLQLEVDYENLAGETKDVKALELINFMERRGRYHELIHNVLSTRS